MEASGLQRIISLCSEFGVEMIDKQLRKLQERLDEDEARLRERVDDEILHDMNNPQDVYNAIQARTSGTRARDLFLSMMQHMLLIREEGPALVPYYQLMDSLVTDVVLDKKLAGAEARLGMSVSTIIDRFNDSDRIQSVELELAEARAQMARMKLEMESVQQQVAQGGEGLVGQLQEELARVEGKLAVSRDKAGRLEEQVETQRADYEMRIEQLEAQIMELFRMLKDFGSGVDKVLDTTNMNVETKVFIESLEKNLQRSRAFGILDGGDRWKKKKAGANGLSGRSDSGDESGPGETDATPGRSNGRSSRKKGKAGKQGAYSSAAVDGPNGRDSQFMDADDADAQEQMQQQLAAGVAYVCLLAFFFFEVIHLFLPVLSKRWRYHLSQHPRLPS
jgi:cytokinesis protein